jgi:hypothetical protein
LRAFFAALAFSTAVLLPSLVIAAGNSPLLVVDSLNNRVLLFRLPFHNAQAAASVELGQPNFKSALPGAGQNLLGGEPVGAILDKHGAIWVTDENNNRVLRFSPRFGTAKGRAL